MVDQAIIQPLTEILSHVYTSFIVALLILLLGILLGRFVGMLLQKLLHEFDLDKLVRRTTSFRISLEEIIAGVVSYIIYFLAIMVALERLGITMLVVQVLSILLIVTIIASIFLGVRDLFPNLIAGLFLHQKRFLLKGDKVKIGDIEGEIIEITLLETRVRSTTDDIIYLPNSLLMKREVIKRKP